MAQAVTVDLPSACVLDSLAILAYLNNEAGAGLVEALLERGHRRQTALSMHAVNLGEVYYVLHRTRGELAAETAYAKVRTYPIRLLVSVDEDFLLTAARLKARYPVSYADAFAAATAILLQVPLVTGDPEFQVLARDRLLTLLWKE